MRSAHDLLSRGFLESLIAIFVSRYYQTKRPTLGDSRIALLSPDFFRAKTVLDIGCNEGWISCEIGES